MMGIKREVDQNQSANPIKYFMEQKFNSIWMMHQVNAPAYNVNDR